MAYTLIWSPTAKFDLKDIKDIVTLKEVANDLNEGKDYYDQREAGVGDYFWDSFVRNTRKKLTTGFSLTKSRCDYMLNRKAEAGFLCS